MSAPRTTNRATQLRQTSRKVDRVNQALAAMRTGRSLHLEHHNGKALWSLSDGRPVTAEVAVLVIRHALVEPADTAVVSDLPGQEWRHR